jgi:hypothetical protein
MLPLRTVAAQGLGGRLMSQFPLQPFRVVATSKSRQSSNSIRICVRTNVADHSLPKLGLVVDY